MFRSLVDRIRALKYSESARNLTEWAGFDAPTEVRVARIGGLFTCSDSIAVPGSGIDEARIVLSGGRLMLAPGRGISGNSWVRIAPKGASGKASIGFGDLGLRLDRRGHMLDDPDGWKLESLTLGRTRYAVTFPDDRPDDVLRLDVERFAHILPEAPDLSESRGSKAIWPNSTSRLSDRGFAMFATDKNMVAAGRFSDSDSVGRVPDLPDEAWSVLRFAVAFALERVHHHVGTTEIVALVVPVGFLMFRVFALSVLSWLMVRLGFLSYGSQRGNPVRNWWQGVRGHGYFWAIFSSGVTVLALIAFSVLLAAVVNLRYARFETTGVYPVLILALGCWGLASLLVGYRIFDFTVALTREPDELDVADRIVLAQDAVRDGWNQDVVSYNSDVD